METVGILCSDLYIFSGIQYVCPVDFRVEGKKRTDNWSISLTALGELINEPTQPNVWI